MKIVKFFIKKFFEYRKMHYLTFIQTTYNQPKIKEKSQKKLLWDLQ